MQGHFPLAKPPEGREGKCKKILYSKTICLFYSKIKDSFFFFFFLRSFWKPTLGFTEYFKLLLYGMVFTKSLFKNWAVVIFLAQGKNDSSPDVIMTLFLKLASISSWTFPSTAYTGWILLMELFCFLSLSFALPYLPKHYTCMSLFIGFKGFPQLG